MRLDADRQSLAGHPDHVRLARRIAASFARRFPALADDFESAAGLALCEAAASFDPRRGVAFATFADRAVRNEMGDVLRRRSPRGYRRKAGAPATTSIESRVAAGPGDLVRLADTLEADEEPVGWAAEYHEELRALDRRAGTWRHGVLQALYGRADAITHDRAGRALGLSRIYIHRLHTRAIETLRSRSA